MFQGCATTDDAAMGGVPDYTAFAEGVAMADDVRSRLGDPTQEGHNPDGRFVFVYKTDMGTYTYMFDTSGKLVRLQHWDK